MKKFLSLMLSVSLLIVPMNCNCSAATRWKSDESSQKDEFYNISTKKDKFIVKGKSMPTIVINNNCDARAESKSESAAKSNSRSTAKASAGNSKGVELLKIALKVVGALVAIRYARLAINKGKDVFVASRDKLMESLKDTFNKDSIKDFFDYVMERLESLIKTQQVTGNEPVNETEKDSIWKKAKDQLGDMADWLAKIAPALYNNFVSSKNTDNTSKFDGMSDLEGKSTFTASAA